MSVDYQLYPYSGSSDTTVSDFLTANDSIVSGMNVSQFLAFGNEVRTNLEQIWYYYTEAEKKEHQTSYNNRTLTLLKAGSAVFVKKDNLREMLEVIGVNRLSPIQSAKPFIAKKLKEIQDDLFYTKDNTLKASANKYDISTIYNNCQVWVYSRALNRLIDITAFISHVSTSVDASGGSFSMTVSPASNIFENLYTQKDTINYTDINVDRKVNESWFVKTLQTNDIFFIKFEKLKNESRSNYFDVSKTELPGKIYDMIGLMDNIDSSYSPVLNELSINIQGRDFMKMLTEDGSFFHPYAFVEGALEKFFITLPNQEKYFQRLFTDGQFKTLFTLGFKSVRNALAFVLNQLVNTGISTSNDLFSAYTDKAEPYKFPGNNSDLSNVTVNGIYQIIHLLVDNQLDEKMVVNDGISNPNGTLLDQMHKICQQPFVEFYGDTYGDSYHYIARRPPLEMESVQAYIKDELIVEINASQVYNFSFNFHTDYYSLYQLKPENSFLGKSDSVALAHFPAIIIPPYVDAFGNNRMIVSSNYISYKAFKNVSENNEINLFREAAIQDLLYLIGSTIYLPFTRKGTITIKGGDRRIKKGNWIYFEPTDEYFYVKGVQNSMRVGRNELDRETTITVERGMKKPFVFGTYVYLPTYTHTNKDVSVGVPPAQGANTLTTDSGNRVGLSAINRATSPKKRFTKDGFVVSYFNLIDQKTLSDKLSNFAKNSQSTGNNEILTSIINDNVFNFFMLKLQFDTPDL